jgi:hypothetical protein
MLALYYAPVALIWLRNEAGGDLRSRRNTLLNATRASNKYTFLTRVPVPHFINKSLKNVQSIYCYRLHIFLVLDLFTSLVANHRLCGMAKTPLFASQ